MRIVPRRLVMTDAEKELFYGHRNPFFRSRYQELQETIATAQRCSVSLDPSAYSEFEGYLQQLKEIDAREPDYRAITRNAGWETLATALEALCVPFMLGGLTIRFDGLWEKKSLPYKTQLQQYNQASA